MEVSLKEQIVKFRSEGLKYREIKNKLSCTMSLVSYHCKNAGLETLNENRKPTKEQLAEIQSLYDLGSTLPSLSKQFDWSISTLSKYISTRPRKKYSDEEIKLRIGQQQMSRRRKLKELLVAYKGGSCELCGYNKCIRALDFHHLDPKTKEFTVSLGTYSFEKLKIEVDKCQLVCANCHREIEDKEYKNK